MAEFHFLRPAWLLLLPLAAWLAWRIGTGRGGLSGWLAVVDKKLQPYVLSDGENVSQRRWPLFTALAAALLSTLALAGPSWDRQPVPAYRADDSLVVALDLSRSMDATDLAPTRLARARLKILDLLEHRVGGQTALIVFTSNAFAVTPLTTDNQTIASMVAALSTDIMPVQGSLIEVGLEMASDLLRRAGASRGEILLITDATASPRAFDVSAQLLSAGVATSVLAVGTEEGAPIPELGGGFVTDSRGQVVLPQLNFDNLERLARSGGGRFARLATGDSDLERLFPGGGIGRVDRGGEEEGQQAEIWRDQGFWLTLALLPLVALGFRRGWVYILLAGIILPLQSVEASVWSDLWLRRDQQGVRALERDAPDEAAELFEDPEWLAAARYRAGQYDASAFALGNIDTTTAHYNRGNALARSGKLAEAIDAYDLALELTPDHADAIYNRELVAELLEQQPESEQTDSGQDESDQNGDQQSGADDQQSDQQAQDDATGSGQQQQQASNQQQDPGADPGESNEDQEGESEQQPADSDDSEQTEEQGQSLQAAMSPEDIEDWASEQAAEQWLRRIPQDPGGLLRRKFLYQYQQLGRDQQGNVIMPGSAAEPW